MTHADTIRQVLRAAAGPLNHAELLDATDLVPDELSKQLYTFKKRGEIHVSVLNGKPAYALHPDYVPARQGRRPNTPAKPRPSPPVAAPKPTPPPPAAGTTPTPPTAAPEASPIEKLAGFAKSASALADETLERAVCLTAPPDLVLQLTRASRLLHTAAMRLAGGAP